MVYLLEHEPASKRIRELSTFDVAPESFVVRGRELYAWHPHGVQGSALAKLLARDTLGVAMTARNWNTVAKLLALAYAT
ncbi:MAG: hypothetical protein ACRDM1_12000 [Gaiellaceae bacterium]